MPRMAVVRLDVRAAKPGAESQHGRIITCLLRGGKRFALGLVLARKSVNRL